MNQQSARIDWQTFKKISKEDVLAWCDESGTYFDDVDSLEKAKRSGKAFLCIAKVNTLPSPFDLTGDIRWNKGGDLYETFDLQLDEEDIDLATINNSDTNDEPSTDETAVKVLSEKTNDEIKKMLEDFRKNPQAKGENAITENQLFNSFNKILSCEGVSQ